MKCPKCGAELSTRTVEPLELELCPSCGGVWFDQGELQEAKDLADENLRWMDFEIWKHEDRFQMRPGILCPRCAATMCSLDYDDTRVRVEYCPSCRGIWLDRPEFERIVQSLERELAGKPASELLAASLREALELVKGRESLVAEWRDLRQVLRLLHLRLKVENPRLHDRVLTVLRSTPFT